MQCILMVITFNCRHYHCHCRCDACCGSLHCCFFPHTRVCHASNYMSVISVDAGKLQWHMVQCFPIQCPHTLQWHTCRRSTPNHPQTCPSNRPMDVVHGSHNIHSNCRDDQATNANSRNAEVHATLRRLCAVCRNVVANPP